jgi:hypothetical protein
VQLCQNDLSWLQLFQRFVFNDLSLLQLFSMICLCCYPVKMICLGCNFFLMICSLLFSTGLLRWWCLTCWWRCCWWPTRSLPSSLSSPADLLSKSPKTLLSITFPRLSATFRLPEPRREKSKKRERKSFFF